jgi:hypothetical protein
MENKMGSVMGVSDDKPKSKEERIRDFVKSMQAIDQAIQPYKEQRTDLKKNYVDNVWLSKEEMKYVTKCYNLAKREDFDLDKFVEMFNKVKE